MLNQLLLCCLLSFNLPTPAQVHSELAYKDSIEQLKITQYINGKQKLPPQIDAYLQQIKSVILEDFKESPKSIGFIYIDDYFGFIDTLSAIPIQQTIDILQGILVDSLSKLGWELRLWFVTPEFLPLYSNYRYKVSWSIFESKQNKRLSLKAASERAKEKTDLFFELDSIILEVQKQFIKDYGTAEEIIDSIGRRKAVEFIQQWLLDTN